MTLCGTVMMTENHDDDDYGGKEERRMKMKLKKKMDTQCQYCITTEHGS